MSKWMVLALGVACLAGGTVIGALVFDDRTYTKPVERGEAVAGSGGAGEMEGDATREEPLETQPFGIQSQVQSREEMIRRIAQLEKSEDDLKARNADLQGQLDEFSAVKGAKTAEVRQRLAEMAKLGLGAFGQPGETARLVADLKALGSLGLDMVLDLLNSDDSNARFMAAKLLEDMSDPRSIPDLKRLALEDDNEMARNMASHALAFMKGGEVVPTLREVYENAKADGVRVNSLAGLAIHNDPQGVKDTVAFIQNEKEPRGLRAAMSGILIMPEAHLMPVAAVVSSQFHDNDQIMGLVINFYGQVGTHAARDRLQAIIDDPATSNELRTAAQQALNR